MAWTAVRCTTTLRAEPAVPPPGGWLAPLLGWPPAVGVLPGDPPETK
jgi:hypothetical protein